MDAGICSVGGKTEDLGELELSHGRVDADVSAVGKYEGGLHECTEAFLQEVCAARNFERTLRSLYRCC